MRLFAFGTLLGGLSLGLLKSLPPSLLAYLGLFLLMLMGHLLSRIGRHLRASHRLGHMVMGMLFGSCWQVLVAESSLAKRLPFSEQRYLLDVVGWVCSIPDVTDNGIGFDLCVLDNHKSVGRKHLLTLSQKPAHFNDFAVSKARVHWYKAANFATSDLSKAATKLLHSVKESPKVVTEVDLRDSVSPGQIWQMRLALKTPYRLHNPGGFDFERWALLNGIDAIGYVVDSAQAKLIDDATFERLVAQQTLLKQFSTLLAQQLIIYRASIIQSLKLALTDRASASWQIALLTGHKQLSDSDRQLLQNSGTAHLLAISGLHIGLIFALSYWMIGLAYRQSGCLCNWLPAESVSLFCASLMAFLFALNSGFALPTQRAMVALTIVIIGKFWLVNWSSSQRLAMMFIALYCFDPIAVWSASFWLSFAAIAIIFWLMQRKPSKAWRSMIFLQPILAVAMSVISALAFGSFSINTVLTNLLAIPLISFVVLPVCLVGFLLLPISLNAATVIFSIVDFVLTELQALLESLNVWLPAITTSSDSAVVMLLFSLSILLIAILPNRKYFSMLSLSVLAMALALSSDLLGRYIVMRYDTNNRSGASLTVYWLDIGQGLSVIANYEGRWLVYDTGFANEHYSTVKSSIIPFLSEMGVTEIEWLIISHSDSDHAGDYASLLQKFPVKRFISGSRLTSEGSSKPLLVKPSNDISTDNSLSTDKKLSPEIESCRPMMIASGQLSIHFWQALQSNYSNDESCVVTLQLANRFVFLTGDVSRNVELEWLVANKHIVDQISELSGVPPSVVLQAPHHGSKSSSSWSMLSALQPNLAIFSSGYLNAFGHPHHTITQRYDELSIKTLNTWRSGMIITRLSPTELMQIRRRRQHKQFYWNHHVSSRKVLDYVVN
ncbi:MAG: DNA internalization-related competence protein ComEC/Rec2 [Kangiellaceae bacterium]|jgi:competence protein ComEC|nr:DNA internalization-related competence protein ComEC/Rec2 [Kangiellaceae bacterium]